MKKIGIKSYQNDAKHLLTVNDEKCHDVVWVKGSTMNEEKKKKNL